LTATAVTLQDKFRATSDSMQNMVFERGELIDIIINGFISGTNVFTLGEPGVAKTFTFELFKRHIANLKLGDWFVHLMGRYTTPSEIWGAIDVAALDQGIHRHVIDHRSMAVAYFAFLDEIWKANSSMANSLLSALNEGIFYNDVPVTLNLHMVGAASNELPQGEGLEAIYDRFGFRYVTEPIKSTSNKRRMLESKIASSHEIIPTLTWEDIDMARKEALAIPVSDDVLDALVELHSSLRSEGLKPSDRRMASTIPVCQAEAWRRGAEIVEIEDMHKLNHMMWETPNQKPIADKHVLGLAAPLEAEALKLRGELDKLTEEMMQVIANGDNEVQKRQAAVSLHGKLKRANAEAKSLRQRSNRESESIKALCADSTDLMRRMLRDLLLVDPDEVLNDEG
jgi:MoxR-like ATPase